MQLQQLQKDFVFSLHNDSSHPILSHIQSHKKVPPTTQFSIYQSSIIGRLQKALQSHYPVCCQLVGTDFFFAMATAYIRQTPSYSHDINYYGATFPEFIADFPPAQSIPYIADVARLEWAWLNILTAPEADEFDFQKLAAHDEEGAGQLIFQLPPKSTLLTSPYPVHTIWETNQKGYVGETAITLEENKNYYYFIWQKQFEIHIDLLTAAQWQLLTWISENRLFAEICEKAMKELPKINLPELLPIYIQSGWIANFVIE